LGFEKTFSVDVKKIMPGEKYEISQNIGMIPAYK
jgi:hypothetical protein